MLGRWLILSYKAHAVCLTHSVRLGCGSFSHIRLLLFVTLTCLKWDFACLKLATLASCAPSLSCRRSREVSLFHVAHYYYYHILINRWRKRRGYATYNRLAISVPALGGSSLGELVVDTGCLSSSVTPWMIHSRAASPNTKPIASSANGPASVDFFRLVG